MESKIECGTCGSTIKLTAHTIPPKNKTNKVNDQFPYVKALLFSADKIHITWGFDEQQADPIHQGYSLSNLKAELRVLLEQADLVKKHDITVPKLKSELLKVLEK